jgi:transcriptional regulator with XRE-family HTH domain
MKLTIGEYIHELRVKNEMTLTQLGALIGVDSGALSKIENGKKVLDRKNLIKIAETFSLDLNGLYQQFISEKVALEIIDYSCDESVLKLVEEKIKLYKSKNIKQAELNF